MGKSRLNSAHPAKSRTPAVLLSVARRCGRLTDELLWKMALNNLALQSWRKSVGWWILAVGTTTVAVSCGSEDLPTEDDPMTSDGGAMGKGGAKGTGGEPKTSESVLEITSSFPAKDSDVNTSEPFLYVFNVPLDEETVESALRVRAAGRNVPVEWAVDENELRIWFKEVPDLPVSLSVALGRDLKGKNGESFAGEAFTVSAPLWFPLTKIEESSESVAFAQASDFSILAYEDNGKLRVVEGRIEETTALSLPGQRDYDGVTVIGAEAHDGGITLIWTEQAGANHGFYITNWDGENWQGGDEPVWEAAEIQVATSRKDDALILAVLSGTEVRIYSGNLASQPQSVASLLSVNDARATELAVTLDASGNAVVATVTSSGQIEVHQATASSWSPLSTVERARADSPARPSLTLHRGSIWLVFEDGDQFSHHAYVAELEGSSFEIYPALDLELDAEASHVHLASSADELYLAWAEWSGVERRAFVGSVQPGQSNHSGK